MYILYFILLFSQIRSLEERLSALENQRAGIVDQKMKENAKVAEPTASKLGDSQTSATKRKLLETATKLIKPSSR